MNKDEIQIAEESGVARFVLGLDLDGTCADFYGRMREIAAEWTGNELVNLMLSAEIE